MSEVAIVTIGFSPNPDLISIRYFLSLFPGSQVFLAASAESNVYADRLLSLLGAPSNLAILPSLDGDDVDDLMDRFRQIVPETTTVHLFFTGGQKISGQTIQWSLCEECGYSVSSYYLDFDNKRFWVNQDSDWTSLPLGVQWPKLVPSLAETAFLYDQHLELNVGGLVEPLRSTFREAESCAALPDGSIWLSYRGRNYFVRYVTEILRDEVAMGKALKHALLKLRAQAALLAGKKAHVLLFWAGNQTNVRQVLFQEAENAGNQVHFFDDVTDDATVVKTMVKVVMQPATGVTSPWTVSSFSESKVLVSLVGEQTLPLLELYDWVCHNLSSGAQSALHWLLVCSDSTKLQAEKLARLHDCGSSQIVVLPGQLADAEVNAECLSQIVSRSVGKEVWLDLTGGTKLASFQFGSSPWPKSSMYLSPEGQPKFYGDETTWEAPERVRTLSDLLNLHFSGLRVDCTGTTVHDQEGKTSNDFFRCFNQSEFSRRSFLVPEITQERLAERPGWAAAVAKAPLQHDRDGQYSDTKTKAIRFEALTAALCKPYFDELVWKVDFQMTQAHNFSADIVARSGYRIFYISCFITMSPNPQNPAPIDNIERHFYETIIRAQEAGGYRAKGVLVSTSLNGPGPSVADLLQDLRGGVPNHLQGDTLATWHEFQFLPNADLEAAIERWKSS